MSPLTQEQTCGGNADADWRSLEKEARIFRMTPLAKLLSHPVRMVGSKCLERLALAGSKGLRRQVGLFWGGRMVVILPERVSLGIQRYRFFEEELSSIFLHCVKPGMVVYDVGAHFGYFSLLASHLVGPQGRVFSFEPTPSTFSLLSENTKPATNITGVNAALWSSECQMSFRDYGLSHAAFNSVAQETVVDNMAAGSAFAEKTVQATTVDAHVVATGARPDFLKIDAEGAEIEILKGMQRTMSECRPLMTVEVGDLGSATNSKSRALLDYAVSQGYEPYEWRDGGLRKHSLLPRYSYDNILLAPRR